MPRARAPAAPRFLVYWRHVDLSLHCRAEELFLEVADDGRGFLSNSSARRSGLGLRSAAERVRAVGGYLSVNSSPGRGPTVRVTVPLGGARTTDTSDA